MKKRYLSPVAESMCIQTTIIAASAPAARMTLNLEEGDTDTGKGSWGSIWE